MDLGEPEFQASFYCQGDNSPYNLACMNIRNASFKVVILASWHLCVWAFMVAFLNGEILAQTIDQNEIGDGPGYTI